MLCIWSLIQKIKIWELINFAVVISLVHSVGESILRIRSMKMDRPVCLPNVHNWDAMWLSHIVTFWSMLKMTKAHLKSTTFGIVDNLLTITRILNGALTKIVTWSLKDLCFQVRPNLLANVDKVFVLNAIMKVISQQHARWLKNG